MMTDIFSSFDPRDFPAAMSVQIPASYPWILSLLALPMLMSQYWAAPTRQSTSLFSPIALMMALMVKLPTARMAATPHLITALFIMLIYMNLMGLTPYIFGMSAHLVITLSLSMPLWMSFILSAITYAPQSWLASFVPTGSPTPLIPFLIMIEFVSVTVRFITLSVRLMANIVAGHVILGMLGVFISSALILMNMWSLISMVLGHLVYMTFEFGVALIQAYIFCMLLVLYSGEHPAMKDIIAIK